MRRTIERLKAKVTPRPHKRAAAPKPGPNQRLPQELIDAIIDEIAVSRSVNRDSDSLAALLACSLVSHTFLPRARLHIWQSINIKGPLYRPPGQEKYLNFKDRIAELMSILEMCPEISSLVHELQFTCFPGKSNVQHLTPRPKVPFFEDPILGHTLRLFPQVEDLTLCSVLLMAEWANFSDNLQQAIRDRIQDSQSPLLTLSLDGITIPQRLLSTIQNLKTLHLGEVHVISPESSTFGGTSTTDTLSAGPALQTLILRGDWKSFFFTPGIADNLFRNLTSIDLALQNQNEIRFIQLLLLVAGPTTLQSLNLCFSSFCFSALAPGLIRLDRAQHLTHLSVSFMDVWGLRKARFTSYSCVSCISQMLTSLPPTSPGSQNKLHMTVDVSYHWFHRSQELRRVFLDPERRNWIKVVNQVNSHSRDIDLEVTFSHHCSNIDSDSPTLIDMRDALKREKNQALPWPIFRVEVSGSKRSALDLAPVLAPA